MYTSLKLSKKLAENGCELESEKWHEKEVGNKFKWHLCKAGTDWAENSIGENCYPSYDILNDICVKYAEEFFGEDEKVVTVQTTNFAHHEISKIYKPGHTAYVMDLLQEGKPEEAEDYIWDNCKFNKDNK